MEEWENHFHLSGGHCFEMYFMEFNEVIRFRVIRTDNGGNKTAINCATGEQFQFNQNELLKKEYATLVEINCKDCE